MCKEKQISYDLETMMQEYGNDVLRTAYMYVRDYHVAEDIFQDVFIKANQKLSTFRGESSIKTWLIRITVNTCKDYLKSAYNRKVVPILEFKEDAITSDDAYDEVEKQDQNLLIRQAVMDMPSKYKDLLLCVYFQEMTLNEAADTLHIALGTAKSRMSRAKDKLRLILEGRI